MTWATNMHSGVSQGACNFNNIGVHASNVIQAFSALGSFENMADLKELSSSLCQSLGGFGVFGLLAKNATQAL